MMVYLLILVIAYLGLLFQYGKDNKEFFYIALLILCFFVGFKGENIGIDTQYYHEAFKDIAGGDKYYINEPVYVLLVKFVNQIGGTQQLVFLIVSAFTLLFYGKFILKYSSNPYLSLFIFITMGVFYLSTYNQARQYLAISIFACFSLKYIQDKSFWKYSMTIFLAALCGHLSALFLIPFYFLLGHKSSVFQRVVMLLLVLLGGNLFVYLINISPYAYFVVRWEETESRSMVLILMQIVTSLIIICFEKRICRKENMILFFNMNYVSLLFSLAMLTIPNIPQEMLGRINNYFYVTTLILLPCILGLFKKSSRIIITLALVLFLTLYYLRNTYIQGVDSMLYPYESSFELFKFK